jgi:hypothetical protein
MSFFTPKSVNLKSLTKRLRTSRLQPQKKVKPVERQELILPFSTNKKWKEKEWEAFMRELLWMDPAEQEGLFENLNQALSSGEPVEPSRVMEYMRQWNERKRTQRKIVHVPENSVDIIAYVHQLVQESHLSLQAAITAHEQATHDLQEAIKTGRAAKKATDQGAWHVVLSEADHSFQWINQIQQKHKTTFDAAMKKAQEILGEDSTDLSKVSGIYTLWNPLIPLQYLYLSPEQEKLAWKVHRSIQEAETKLSRLNWNELEQESKKWMEDLQSNVKFAQEHIGTHIK